ncbi:hypothetical protein BT93_L4330 [Corymbia citriodora subsp. variegata]|uniref:Uncharacterized protein n=1 Tax=Corymbia citriodora subsp. variegata TaxID=360336 RepID=A0A8T0CWW9_CORYI|nr:hypothetical protein BT93_L4330 [Corymbia citriodora subsp. variegata]
MRPSKENWVTCKKRPNQTKRRVMRIESNTQDQVHNVLYKMYNKVHFYGAFVNLIAELIRTSFVSFKQKKSYY